MIRPLITSLLLLLSVSAFAQLKSPDQFLPHRLGEQFTHHHILVSYFEHVAANSPNVRILPYGSSTQGRPLIVAVISTPENLAKLEDIRINHLRRAGLAEGRPDATLDRAIVGLGFSVHGNEAAGSESSMAVLHQLADPGNASAQAWLKNTVVLLDPSMNPDGYSRYTNWYRDVSPVIADPRREAREHREPWPGGRPNHYMFDLNRDWAWQTQAESRQRARFFHSWLPHVFADIHEQGPNEPYYFAPAAEPFHAYITDWQRKFQTQIGQNHARHFDREGWLYFTKERFDLLYPSYGDTYPTYMGSIGMTYEQGGIGAGRALIIENGDTLTLRDRVTHHRTAALSTVEVASQHVADLVKNFQAHYDRSRTNPPGRYKAFIIKASNPAGKLAAFAELLDRNGIRYGKAGKNASLKGFDYIKGAAGTAFKIEENDLVISAYQPAGTMAQILMEPQTQLADSVTYDITAWSLPYAHGLEAYALEERLEPQGAFALPAPAALPAGAAPYAYLVKWNSMNAARFLADVSQQGIGVRFARSPFRIEGQDYAAGTLIITRADNRLAADFLNQTVSEAIKKHKVDAAIVRSGMVEKGFDFGSDAVPMAARPRIAVLSGEGTSANSYGQVWYYLEKDLGYPFAALPANNLGSLDLSNYDLLIMADGGYGLDEGAAGRLSQWISKGGRLIAVGYALNSLQGKSGFALTRYESKDAENKAEREAEKAELDSRLLNFGDQERRAISGEIPGAIFKVKMDITHPLAFGMGEHYFSLKTGAGAYPWLKGAWNVGSIGDNPNYYGFVGQYAQQQVKNSAVFAVEDKGRGAVIYMVDNPLFRGFWENGKLLFSNAVFFTGQ
ncbi:MAG TPA: M14 family metallopeptidase [Saprospiraceae bacterium]|nr:M14 family metallopeptidase [Saprospiraceae bacterium]